MQRKSMKEAAASIRARVLDVVRDAGANGANGDEVADHLGLHVTQVRSRLSELLAARKIVASKATRIGASGRRGTVWVMPEYGPPTEDECQFSELAA